MLVEWSLNYKPNRDIYYVGMNTHGEGDHDVLSSSQNSELC